MVLKNDFQWNRHDTGDWDISDGRIMHCENETQEKGNENKTGNGFAEPSYHQIPAEQRMDEERAVVSP